jgi:hypothetical protein
MKPYSVKLYSSGEKLPEMSSSNFFHSPEFFHILEKAPGQKPFMAIVTNAEGRVVAHLLAYLHRRGSFLPPYLYTQGRIYGDGEYEEDEPQEELFGMMLEAITKKFRFRLCLFIEQSDSSRKMFGYHYFRKNGYFPVPWMEVHNSLHSMKPEDRVSAKLLFKIEHIEKMGVTTREPVNEQEVKDFYKMMKGYYRTKVRRIIPPLEQVMAFYHSESIKIFVTLYKERIIGGCLCACTMGNVFLWYFASLRKRYRLLHPDTMTVWYAIKWAWKHNFAHIDFSDVGLPYSKSRQRQFFLKFGGKPVAKYRWFHFTFSWLNRLLNWIYRE